MGGKGVNMVREWNFTIKNLRGSTVSDKDKAYCHYFMP